MSEKRLDTFDPIFLLSTERSGSNLVRSILGTHPDISAPHPLETAYPWGKVTPPHEMSDRRAKRLLRDVLVNKHYSFHPLERPIDINDVFERYKRGKQSHSLFDLQQAFYDEYASEEESTAWVSKYPALWDSLDEAFEYYDNPKIVYNVRDPRDVVLSFKRSNVGRYHPYFNAQRWQEEQSRGIELLENHGASVHQIRYKDLLQDPESVVRGVCDFLEIEFDERMLYYYETDEAQAASESADVFENLTSPIMSDNYDKFRDQLSEDEIRLTEKIAGEELKYFGYDPVYSDAELDRFELEIDRYGSTDRSLTRKAMVKDWLSNPREQIKRNTARSFAGYMIFRYGVFG
jgi:hypothetical protein